MKCSSACASCARMRTARSPPAAKQTSDVPMYSRRIRLWSTVVIQLDTRPRRQSARYVSTLAATRLPLVDDGLQVLLEGSELIVRPRASDGRHVARRRLDAVLAIGEEPAQALRLNEQRAGRDIRPVAALAAEPVALRADAEPFVA